MKYLLIAEKPSLMNSIKDVYLAHKSEIPFSIDFTFQAGHIVSLLLPSELDEAQKTWCWENIPFAPENVGGWKYKVMPDKVKLFKEIKTKIHSGDYDGIIHAGDADQEGQLLCNLLLQECGNKLPVKRLWVNDLNDGPVLDALLHLRDNDKDDFLVNLGKAALARQHSDYRIGMNCSMAVSLKTNTRASIGRVKSPVTKIIVDREIAIRNFKPTTTYELKVNYKENFSGTLFTEEDGNTSFATKEEALEFAKTLNDTATVKSFEKKKEKKFAPPLFKLATLQIEASKSGYNADKTLGLAQSLYEKKILSYPRTSCEFIASTLDFKKLLDNVSVFPDLEPFVKKITNADIERVKKDTKYVNDKKLKESGHYALSPTVTKPNLSILSEDEKFILNLVFKQFVAIFLPPLVQDKTTIITENKGNLFKSTGKILIDKGYTELLTTAIADKDLPTLKNGDIVNIDKFEDVEKTTTCPKRFSEGDIIEIMENPSKYLEDEHYKSALKSTYTKGIGTPATRHSILKQLIEKDGYIEKKAGKGKNKVELIYATPIGEQLIEAIKDMDFCKVDMTAIWEEKLEDVRLGNVSFDKFEQSMMDYTSNLVEQIKNDESIKKQAKISSKVKAIGSCPCCGKSFVVSDKYYYCTGYSKEGEGCKLIFKKDYLSKNITEKEAIKIITTGLSSKMKFKNPKTNKTFECELKLNKEEMKLDFNFEKPTNEILGSCPLCSKNVLDKGMFVACEEYKKSCDFSISKKIKEASLDNDDIISILNGGETKEIQLSNNKVKLAYDKESKKLLFIANKKELGQCPSCKKKVLDNGKFACCEDYKKGCNFSVSYSIKGAVLSPKDVQKLLKGEETDFKKFSFGEAKIKYNNSTNKLDFIFKKNK